jgi:hypothetical protein
LGFCCYTEYWGKLLLGIKKKEKIKPIDKPFNEFLCRLDRIYYPNLLKLLAEQNLNIYYDIRCGLAHAYMIEGGKSATIDTGDKGQHGIEYDFEKSKYTFWVRAYFEEFKNAVISYIRDLEEGTEDLAKLTEALRGRPELI